MDTACTDRLDCSLVGGPPRPGRGVSREEQVDRAVAAAYARFQRIDILFNHAGIIIVKPFLDFTVAEWDGMMDNNAKSAFMVTRRVLPRMLQQGNGVIINTAFPHAQLGEQVAAG